jgi:hypothetical protein
MMATMTAPTSAATPAESKNAMRESRQIRSDERVTVVAVASRVVLVIIEIPHLSECSKSVHFC